MEKNNHSLESQKNVIYSIDLSETIEYLQKQKNWSVQKVSIACKQYKNYLYLLVKHPKSHIPPSFLINEVWEAHVLQNVDKYREFCRKLFAASEENLLNHKNFFIKGKFISSKDKYDFEHTTKDLYHKEFNEKLTLHEDTITITTKVINYLKRKHRWVIGMAFPILLAAFITYASSYNDTISNVHKTIEDLTREISYDDEDTYIICNSGIAQKNASFELQIIYNLTLLRRTHLANFYKTVKYAHERNQITHDLYDALTRYAHDANLLYLSGFNMCKMKIKDFNQISNQRNDLIIKIIASENSKQYATFLPTFKLSGDHIASEIEHM